MSGPRLAFLGAGDIANYHADAARHVGFDLAAVAAREGSERAIAFAKKHDFAHVYNDPMELLASRNWDALLVCASAENAFNYAVAAAESQRPTLLEKPVAMKSSDLMGLLKVDTSNIVVGYNRRHYSSVAAAKRFVDESENVLVTLEIPEAVDVMNQDRSIGFRQVLGNSVHMLDLLTYIVGPVNLAKMQPQWHKSSPSGAVLLAESARGDSVVIKAAWNSPSNFSICLESEGRRFLLSPIEIGKLFEGMEVNEPSKERPIRTYSPKLIQEFSATSMPPFLKPGFGEQMLEFRRFIETGEKSTALAEITDAHQAILLAEALIRA